METVIVLIFILGAFIVVFMPTIVAIRNGGPWFVVFIGNLFLPFSGTGWILLTFLGLSKTKRRRR